MTVSSARLLLFIVWLGVWLFYVLFFFLLTVWHKGVSFEQAAKAGHQVTYVLLPIVTAFGSYWFAQTRVPAGATPPDLAQIDMPQSVAMFAITAAVNFIVLLYFLFGVAFVDYDQPGTGKRAFDEAVASGVTMMVTLSALVALPVGFLVGREVIAPPPQQAAGPPP
jgi:hypothetical protein